MTQRPTNVSLRASEKVPGQMETWYSYDGGKGWIMIDDGYPKDEKEDTEVAATFPVNQKYGWTELTEDGIFHHRVDNPYLYHEGCRGTVVMGWTNPDGSRDICVRIAE
jgi:hypothetical protein